MAFKDFDEAISRLEHATPASVAPDFVSVAREVAIALRDAMDAEKHPTALYALALAGPEVMGTILRRHGREALARWLEGSRGWDVVMTLRRAAPLQPSSALTWDQKFMAEQRAREEHDAARQAEVRTAVDTLLQTLEPRDTRDLPTYVIFAKEDAERLCGRMIDVRPDTVLTMALDWLLKQARHWIRPPAVTGDPPRPMPWFIEQTTRMEAVVKELNILIQEAGWRRGGPGQGQVRENQPLTIIRALARLSRFVVQWRANLARNISSHASR